ncbi:hypothetical protein [Streptomyces sp. NPDC056730]|uniref:hypothetical protein n=1 Tax=unclassified Streptomyces TaxID=2593676 RepID=UPI003678CAA6
MAWGWRTYIDTDPSPSKTALCLLALSTVCSGTGPGGEPAYRDGPREAGGVHGPVQRKRLSDVVAEAGQWLLHNHHRWEEFVEDDKDVQGTAWEHMAYALCTQATIRAGASPRDPRLAKAWKLMNDLWDPEAALWNEPGASGKRATIRAAYYTGVGLRGSDAASGPNEPCRPRLRGRKQGVGRDGHRPCRPRSWPDRPPRDTRQRRKGGV